MDDYESYEEEKSDWYHDNQPDYDVSHRSVGTLKRNPSTIWRSKYYEWFSDINEGLFDVDDDADLESSRMFDTKLKIHSVINLSSDDEPYNSDNWEKGSIGVHDLRDRPLNKRHDVWIKSILRTMRRFYSKLMESTTKYKRREKKIYVKHQNLIKSCK